MTYCIDRIEENCAVLQNDAGEQLMIALEDLPEDVREGSVLVYENGMFTKAPAEEAARRKKLFAMMKKLFRKE